MSNHNELNYDRGYQDGSFKVAEFYAEKIERIIKILEEGTIELYDVAAEPIKAVPREVIDKALKEI